MGLLVVHFWDAAYQLLNFKYRCTNSSETSIFDQSQILSINYCLVYCSWVKIRKLYSSSYCTLALWMYCKERYLSETSSSALDKTVYTTKKSFILKMNRELWISGIHNMGKKGLSWHLFENAIFTVHHLSWKSDKTTDKTTVPSQSHRGILSWNSE